MTATMQLELEVQRCSTNHEIPRDEEFRLWAATALDGQEGVVSLAIRVVDEAEALRFNRDYRARDYATNVLSFPAELPAGLPDDIRRSQLGDLLICAPVVTREAQEQRCKASDHWAHLVIHGVLHLLGYDHQQRDEAEVMESLETEMLARLGIGDPYRDFA